MLDPGAVQNLLQYVMPHRQDWRGKQMPQSSPGGLGAAGIDWCIMDIQ